MRKAIYKTGSSLLLENYHDIDEVWFFETREEKLEAVKTLPHEKDRDVHCDYIRPLKVFLACYLYHYMQLIEGEDLHLDEFSIFDHKDEYIALLKRYVSWLPRDRKKWYHILTAVYLLKKGEYKLTKTQLNNIQNTHDNGISDKLYNYIIDYLKDL